MANKETVYFLEDDTMLGIKGHKISCTRLKEIVLDADARNIAHKFMHILSKRIYTFKRTGMRFIRHHNRPIPVEKDIEGNWYACMFKDGKLNELTEEQTRGAIE